MNDRARSHTAGPMNHTGLGRQMAAEMAEQPTVLTALADRFETITQEVRSLVGQRIAGVAFLARGSSDNAALLGRYAVELTCGLPTCLVAPSIATAYRRTPDGFRDWLLVALSQSGQTPEIIHLTQGFAAAGAEVIAITNDPESPLAQAAQLTIALGAGPERAVPATKTVTSQMLAVLAIATALAPSDHAALDVSRIPDAVSAILADTAPISRAAAALSGFDRLAVVGRGACYPAASETALKLQETTGIMAHGFSTADFRHGPVAVCGPASPAVLLAGTGPADPDTRDLRGELLRRGARVTLIGTGDGVDIAWPALGDLGECLLATVRGQQLAHATATALGIDPDRPTGLNKVTLTH
jgi:glucosamine--fructose-6-phosphate aminotransferase (isomerizing)